ncbi:MAG: hypothetical protein MRY79_04720 [Alphaproteobacteria bacterium]|nr:hypothetical protein [Alphaproteobacteria bacterium]
MLNAHLLDQNFVSALKHSWDKAAIWPGCVDGYEEGISHKSYGQCLVGALATWAKHPHLDIVAGIAKDESTPEGVWHFQLRDKGNPIDVTWDQFARGAHFEEANDKLIATESILNDDSLEPRLRIIFDNLKKQGIEMPSPVQIIERAKTHLKL